MSKSPLALSARALVFTTEVIERFIDDRCPQLAAALAYYAIFSLPPLLVITLTGLGLFIQPSSAQALVSGSAQAFLSPEISRQILRLAQQANDLLQQGPWWSIALSFAGLLFAASRGFVQLQRALNRAWGVESGADRTFAMDLIVKRLISFAMLAAMIPLVIASTSVAAVEHAFQEELAQALSGPALALLSFVVGPLFSILFVGALLATVYRFVPDTTVAWREVFPGALVAACGFELLKRLMSTYLLHLELDDVFGQAASLAALLVWLYLAANLVFLGAEFAQTSSERRGQSPGGAPQASAQSELVVTKKLESWLLPSS